MLRAASRTRWSRRRGRFRSSGVAGLRRNGGEHCSARPLSYVAELPPEDHVDRFIPMAVAHRVLLSNLGTT
jgi:hypothetical protein